MVATNRGTCRIHSMMKTTEQTMEPKSWEDLTPLEQAQAIWWDLYKDVHGVRPRGVDTSNWTLEGFNAQIQGLSIALEEVIAEERRAQQEAIRQFEARVDNLLHTGTNRARVIAWLMDAEGTQGDTGYFEFTQGLPYGYLTKTTKEIV
jgi:hypothetical protein